MSAAALVRLARQAELVEGQKIVKVRRIEAAACRERRTARASPAAEPLCLQLLVGLHPAPAAAQHFRSRRRTRSELGWWVLAPRAASCGRRANGHPAADPPPLHRLPPASASQETHGRKILLARTRGQVYATDAHCFHMGGEWSPRLGCSCGARSPAAGPSARGCRHPPIG